MGETASASSWWQWHDRKRDTDMAVAAALEAPGGADYPQAIRVYAASDRPAMVKQAQIGQLIVFAHDDPKPGRLPEQPVAEGLRMLEQASLTDGEGAKIAAENLRIAFERGVGTERGKVILPQAALAACWRSVQTNASKASDCVTRRATLTR